MKRTILGWKGTGVIALLLMTAGNPAVAQQMKHELTGGTNTTLTFSGDNKSFGLELGYRYPLFPEYGVQVAYDTTLDYLSTNQNGVTLWENSFGFRYNLPTGLNFENQFFVDAGLGFSINRTSVGGTSSSTTNFLYEGGAGKLFQLLDNLSYVPRVMIRKVEEQDVRFNFTILAFSFFFSPK